MANDLHAGLESAGKKGRIVVWLAIGVVLGAVLPGAAWVVWPRGEKPLAASAKSQAAAVDEKVAASDARAQLAVLLLTALQVPPPGGGAGDGSAAAADEAGAEFWKAAKAARTGDFKAAVVALDKAKAIHAQRRFSHLKQAQNPDSDPLEEIFLRTCDEIKEYWQLRERLADGGYKDLAKAGATADAVKELLEKKKDSASLTALVDLLMKEKYEVKNSAEVIDGVKKLVQDKKTGDDNLKKSETKLKDAMKAADDNDAKAKDFMTKLADTSKKLDTATGELKSVADSLTAAGVGKKGAVPGIDELNAERNKANGLIDVINRKLKEAKLVPGNAGRADVAGGVDRALVEATSPLVTGLGRMAGSVGQVGGTADIVVAQVFEVANDFTRQAIDEAQRASRQQKAAEEARAEALYQAALSLRNEGKIVEARESLEKALQIAGTAQPGAWRIAAKEALNDVTDPAAYYLPRAEELRNAGQLKEALNLLDQALKSFPKEQQGSLTAERGLVHLARAAADAKGKKLTSADTHIVEAQRDAETAQASGAKAAGFYAAGRIAEELGNWKEAETNYRKAVEAHPTAGRAGYRYKLALERVRLQLQ